MVADVEDQARIALRPRFNHHGPRNPGSGVLASIPQLGGGHGQRVGNWRAGGHIAKAMGS
jgi:hypothetical protein